MRWLLVGMLVLSGCGGDDDDAGTGDAALADAAALADTAVDSAPDAAVTLMFNVLGHDYGSLALGGMTGFPYTVRNVGAVNTGAMTVVITGDDASEFNFGFNGCNGQVLAPQGTCNMAVRFAPAAGGSPGPRVAALRASYAGSSETAQIPITGTALPPPILSLGGSAVLFPDTTVGATSAPQTAMLRNTSTTATVTNLAFSTAGASAAFPPDVVGNGCTAGQSLAPQAMCVFQFRFRPPALGIAMMTLFVSATGPAGTVSTSTVVMGNGI